jgi:hypothetical protein
MGANSANQVTTPITAERDGLPSTDIVRHVLPARKLGFGMAAPFFHRSICPGALYFNPGQHCSNLDGIAIHCRTTSHASHSIASEYCNLFAIAGLSEFCACTYLYMEATPGRPVVIERPRHKIRCKSCWHMCEHQSSRCAGRVSCSPIRSRPVLTTSICCHTWS